MYVKVLSILNTNPGRLEGFNRISLLELYSLKDSAPKSRTLAKKLKLSYYEPLLVIVINSIPYVEFSLNQNILEVFPISSTCVSQI